MSNAEEIAPVVGHHSAWGMVGSRFRVRPYTATPGATEILRVRVREKIDIHGIGMDVVELTGVFTVRRDHPVGGKRDLQPTWKEARVVTEFRALELYGESPLFGTVRVHFSRKHVSFGVVGPVKGDTLAAVCSARFFPVVELPELGLTVNTGSEPIKLGSKVVQIPPVGDVARSENSAPLLDESGNVIGEFVSSDIEVGEVVWAIPLGATEPRGGAADVVAGAKRSPAHGESGPSFFTQAPEQWDL